MKATLSYNLNDPDDRMAHMRAVKSLDMAMALWDIARNSKKSLEWSIDGKDMNKYEVIDMVYEKIWDILEEHNIRLDDLLN